MEIFEDISEHLHPWMIFILAGATLIFKFFSKPISKAIEILFRKKAKVDKIEDLIDHDLFNALVRVKMEVKHMKFYTHGKFDAVKTKMCYDFTRFKADVCINRFEVFLRKDFDSMSFNQLKRELLTEIDSVHSEYVERTTNYWLQKGISKEDVVYIIELFEKFRYDVIQSFGNRIEAIFGGTYHNTRFKKLLACYDMFAMGVDLLPKDMQSTFESMNGRFTNLPYA